MLSPFLFCLSPRMGLCKTFILSILITSFLLTFPLFLCTFLYQLISSLQALFFLFFSYSSKPFWQFMVLADSQYPLSQFLMPSAMLQRYCWLSLVKIFWFCWLSAFPNLWDFYHLLWVSFFAVLPVLYFILLIIYIPFSLSIPLCLHVNFLKPAN